MKKKNNNACATPSRTAYLLAGNVAEDPQLMGPPHKPWTDILLITNRFSYHKGLWERTPAWHCVRVSGPQAETCTQLLKKGFPLAIDATWAPTQRRWIAQQVHFLGLRNKAVHDTPVAPKKGTEDLT